MQRSKQRSNWIRKAVIPRNFFHSNRNILNIQSSNLKASGEDNAMILRLSTTRENMKKTYRQVGRTPHANAKQDIQTTIS